MSGLQYVLSNYPLSENYRRRLESQFAADPTYISMAELRQLPPVAMLRKLRSLAGERLILPIEDEGSYALLPIFELLAAVAPTASKCLVMPDLSVRAISRWTEARAFLALTRASLAAFGRVGQARYQVSALLRAQRIRPEPRANPHRVLYLNANLWFGVKAGGSVGHIAGVANALLQSGYALDFASAGGRQMVSEQARLLPLAPPGAFAVPSEMNYYRFGKSVVRQLAETFRQHPYSFIYQRMSLGNHSGVELSRRYRVPLVLEYNGSEAWVAKHWGQPLRFHSLASRSEEACLKHAHAVVTVSEVLQEELLERGVEAERIVMYPNCIDPGTFDPERLQAAGVKVRERHGLGKDSIVVGFVGTFGQWHGVDVLAQSIRSLVGSEAEWLRRYRVHFLIVGDGAKMPAVRQILEGSGWEEYCTFTGVVPQAHAPEYLAAADVLLSPHVANADGTRFFGSPTKLFEYMAMGRAIVASDLDQIGKVLARSLRTGHLPTAEPAAGEDRLSVLAEPGSAAALIEGIRFCVTQPKWRAVLGRNARTEALAKYTWGHHVAAIRGRLDQLGVVREA